MLERTIGTIRQFGEKISTLIPDENTKELDKLMATSPDISKIFVGDGDMIIEQNLPDGQYQETNTHQRSLQ